MRIRPPLRLACAALACALAVGPGAASVARAQSLIEALSTTYNSNPDLLAQRALLRQTDETLAQAAASSDRPFAPRANETRKTAAAFKSRGNRIPVAPQKIRRRVLQSPKNVL